VSRILIAGDTKMANPPPKRTKVLQLILAIVAIGAVLVWATMLRPPDKRSLPDANYYTGPMRGPAHPDRLVDEQGRIFANGPESKPIQRSQAESTGRPGGRGGMAQNVESGKPSVSR